MKHVISISLLLLQLGAFCQEPKQLNFSPQIDFLKLPKGWYFGEVSGVAINSKDEIYVFNRGAHPLIKFNKDGNFLESMGEDLFTSSHGLKIDRYDNIWTTDVGSHLVLKFDPEGRLLMVLGRSNSPGDFVFTDTKFSLFDRPSDLAFDSQDNIYVTDGYGNSRVVKFNPQGDRLLAWGTKGDAPGQFNLPHAIAIDDDDRLYVGDRENARIQVFDIDGELLDVWDGVGYPYGVLWTGTQLYMADARSEKILLLEKDGSISGTYGQSGKGPGCFGWAHMLDNDSEGNLYVAEILNWRVQKLEKTP